MPWRLPRRSCGVAIDNYPNREPVQIPDVASDVVPGFSHEYINYMLGGSTAPRCARSMTPSPPGRIRGVVANVGCNNPRVQQDGLHNQVVRELLTNDVLVVETGCGALASAKCGLLLGEAAMDAAGHGLREVCEAVGIPPVLHMGSCVDNTRILTVLTQMATEGGLGEDISDIPAVGLAPEWMSEKAMAIATYAAASGVYVIMGVHNPVDGSDEVTQILADVWEKKVGGKIEFVSDPEEIVTRALAHIDKKRAGAQAAGLRSRQVGAQRRLAHGGAAGAAARRAGRSNLWRACTGLRSSRRRDSDESIHCHPRYARRTASSPRRRHCCNRPWSKKARRRRPLSQTPPIICR